MTERPWIVRTALGIMLAILLVQAVSGMSVLTATSDEVSHLPAGYTYIKTGDLRLNPQHPPLIKMLCALPLTLLDPVLDLESKYWLADPPEEYKFGAAFLYGNDADRLLFWGRMPVVLLSLVLGLFVYRFAADLFGRPAGLMALLIYCLSPNIIAHSRLVTTDLGLACFSFIFVYFLWRWSRSASLKDAAAAGLCLGLALAAKFSAVILLMILPVLVALSLVPSLCRAAGSAPRNEREDSMPVTFKSAAYATVLMVSISALLVWMLYLCPGDPSFYWNGMMEVDKYHDPNQAYYLLGQFKTGGFWYYFPVAFLIKTPLPTLGLLLFSLVMWKKLRAPRLLDDFFLVIPAAAFVVVTSIMAYNIGLRYLLPVYPLLFVFVSRLWPVLFRSVPAKVATAALACWLLASAVWIHPDQLAFFNLAVGGPSQGYRYLDDSNLDWGQDLKRLAKYLDDNGMTQVRLLYPWSGSPDYYGISHVRMTPEDWYRKPSPGTYAVATVWLVKGLHEARTADVPTDWLERYEPVDRVAYSFFIYEFD